MESNKTGIKTYRGLIVWERAMDFVTSIYFTTKSFPVDKLYFLTSQIRRIAVSIPGNIAKGFERNSRKEFKRFLRITIGSVFEIQVQIQIPHNNKSTFDNLFESSREIESITGETFSSNYLVTLLIYHSVT